MGSYLWASIVRNAGLGRSCAGRRSLAALLLAAVSLAAPTTAHSGATTDELAPVVDVTEYGARGDGISDDTASIQRALDDAPDGAAVYFPAGTYLAGHLVLSRRQGIALIGAGRSSVLRRAPAAPRQMTISDSRRISITRLSFDANGIRSYGGVMFYSSRGVSISKTRYFDGNKQPVGQTDRYAYVFGRGPSPSTDVSITDNRIEDLQVEVDHARRVEIRRNTILRSVRTAAIGVFSIADGTVATDYVIAGNTIVDPAGAAFAANLDAPWNNRCTFRRITIRNNLVVRARTAGRLVLLGTPDNSAATTGNAFSDISVAHNVSWSARSAPRWDSESIHANASPRAGFRFRRLRIVRNTIWGNGTGTGIDVRMARASRVVRNRVHRMHDGIKLASGSAGTVLARNLVRVSRTAYVFSGSRGRNLVRANVILSRPATRWQIDDARSTDVLREASRRLTRLAARVNGRGVARPLWSRIKRALLLAR